MRGNRIMTRIGIKEYIDFEKDSRIKCWWVSDRRVIIFNNDIRFSCEYVQDFIKILNALGCNFYLSKDI